MPFKPAKPIEQIESIKLQKEFLDCDANGDGLITTKELGNALRCLKVKLRISESEIKKVVREIDLDRNGIVDLTEYYEQMANSTDRNLIHQALLQRAKARAQFKKYDKDKSGFISANEMKLVYEDRTGRKLNMRKMNEILKETDQDGDSQISYDEFLTLMCN